MSAVPATLSTSAPIAAASAAPAPGGKAPADPGKPLLGRLSVAMFGMVMGTGGLANAWTGAHRVFGAPAVIGQALLAGAVLIFVTLVLAHGAKLAFRFADVAEEFAHPMRSSFFPAVSVAAVVLSIGLRPYAHGVADALWWAGAALPWPWRSP